MGKWVDVYPFTFTAVEMIKPVKTIKQASDSLAYNER